MQNVKPWSLVETSKSKLADQRMLDQSIFLCAEAIRIAGILLQPFMPDKARQLLDMAGVDEAQRTFDFAKVEADGAYGVSKIDLGKGQLGVLFPPLASDA